MQQEVSSMVGNQDLSPMLHTLRHRLEVVCRCCLDDGLADIMDKLYTKAAKVLYGLPAPNLTD